MVKNNALNFVIMIGIVNLFGDMTYEGGGVINGPFLGLLGAGAATISIVAGLGEFFGYSLRSLSGYLSDKTGKYWLIAFIGYLINLFAVPAMALATNWQIAAILIIAERTGRAIRKPSVESMLSYAAGKRAGWIFGINTALDEAGATIGPLLVALILYLKFDYKFAYAILLITASLAIISLFGARIFFPDPAKFERKNVKLKEDFSLSYWLYMLAGAVFAAGILSYELVSYHLVKTNLIEYKYIPILLAGATLSGVLASLVLGRLYDKFGLKIIILAIFLSAGSAPLIFLGDLSLIIIAMTLLGISYAVQDTLLKALVAELLPRDKRGLAFGLFYTGYGCGWLVGSIISGLLYEHTLLGLALFAGLVQLCSLPVFFIAGRIEPL